MGTEKLSHRQLQEELARVKTMALVEVPLGGMYINRNSVARADVLEVKPRYEDFVVTIYDVKRTRADFLQSLRKGKWKQYLPHCHRFYFACVSGIAHQREVPTGVGLTLRGPNGWYTPQAANFRDIEVPLDTMKAIMFQRVKAEWNSRRRAKVWQDYRLNKNLKRLGDKVATALEFYDTYHWQIEKLKKEGYL